MEWTVWIIEWVISILGGIFIGLIVNLIISRYKENWGIKKIIVGMTAFSLLAAIIIKVCFILCLIGGLYDKQTYWPPTETGKIYTVIDKRTCNTICVIAEWGKWNNKDKIDITNYRGLVLRLEHLNPDSVPLTVKAKGAIVNPPYQGEVPQEWESLKYRNVSW